MRLRVNATRLLCVRVPASLCWIEAEFCAIVSYRSVNFITAEKLASSSVVAVVRRLQVMEHESDDIGWAWERCRVLARQLVYYAVSCDPNSPPEPVAAVVAGHDTCVTLHCNTRTKIVSWFDGYSKLPVNTWRHFNKKIRIVVEGDDAGLQYL